MASYMEGGPSIQESIYPASNSDDNDDENVAQEAGSTQAIVEKPEEVGCYYSCCDPRGRCHRFIALFFMCLLGFGSYFCYDNPAALHDQFLTDFNITNTQFTLLYSMYSWPNVILCFIGGFLLDSVFGIALGTNIYMFLTLVGQIIFATGAISNVFWVMVLGRFVFGIGAESLAVAQNNYAVLWFKGKELNMVFGLQLSFARVGSTVNFWVMEPIYNWVHENYTGYECSGIVLFLATTTCVLSFICTLLLGCLDKRAERILRRSENSSGEVVRLKDIKDFQITFWLLTVICVAYYIAIFPFIALGKDFFTSKFHLTPQAANTVNSIVYLIAGVASPLLGLLVDKTGKNIWWVVCSILGTIGAHAILAYTLWNPYVGMVLMGISYSVLASSLWPLVALIIPEYQLGTAYGICQAVQNMGLAIVTIITGIILDSGGWFWLELFFMAGLAVALLITIIIWAIDISRKGTLNMTPAQRERHQQNVLAAEVLEREKLLSAGVTSSSSAHDLMQPCSDFHIRNRYLSRIGAHLPSHYNVNMKGLAYRALR